MTTSGARGATQLARVHQLLGDDAADGRGDGGVLERLFLSGDLGVHHGEARAGGVNLLLA